MCIKTCIHVEHMCVCVFVSLRVTLCVFTCSYECMQIVGACTLSVLVYMLTYAQVRSTEGCIR